MNLKDVIYTFSQRNIYNDKEGKINYLNYNSFVYDYDAIEEELGKIILQDIHLFKNDLNFIVYSGEEFKGENFSIIIDFYSKYPQKSLTNSEIEIAINYIKATNGYTFVI